MANTPLNIAITNYGQIMKDIQAIGVKSEKALKYTVSDAKKRAPGWVSSEVVKEYGVKKNDVVKTEKRRNGLAKVYVAGKTVDSLQLVYRGRLVVPSSKRFAMKPGNVPAKKGPYVISATIKGGKTKTLKGNGEAIFLAPARKGNTTIIPWQRMPDGRITPFKSISIPQMIENDKVNEAIYKKINEGIEKRLEGHMKRALKGYGYLK